MDCHFIDSFWSWGEEHSNFLGRWRLFRFEREQLGCTEGSLSGPYLARDLCWIRLLLIWRLRSDSKAVGSHSVRFHAIPWECLEPDRDSIKMAHWYTDNSSDESGPSTEASSVASDASYAGPLDWESHSTTVFTQQFDSPQVHGLSSDASSDPFGMLPALLSRLQPWIYLLDLRTGGSQFRYSATPNMAFYTV